MSAQLPLLVDSHAHLDGGQYANDRDETIQRAHENGISHILTNAIGVSVKHYAFRKIYFF